MAQHHTTIQRTEAQAHALTMLFDAHRDGDALLIQTAMRSLDFLAAMAELTVFDTGARPDMRPTPDTKKEILNDVQTQDGTKNERSNQKHR